jgi:hypothetical protein
MGYGLVWCVRLGLAAILIGAVSLLTAILLFVCDIASELRRALGAVALGAFSLLAALVSAMLIFNVGRHFSRRIRNEMSRRRIRRTQ